MRASNCSEALTGELQQAIIEPILTQRDGGLDLKDGPDRYINDSCLPFYIVATCSMMRILYLSCGKG
jgi:hypothetical protein